MTGYNPDNNQPAYLLGQLFRLMQRLQNIALRPDRGTGDHEVWNLLYYTKFPVCVQNPWTTVKVMEGHLPALVKRVTARQGQGLADILSGEIAGIRARIVDPPPDRVDSADQSLFIVGYHHYGAHLTAREATTKQAAGILGVEPGSARATLNDWARKGWVHPRGLDDMGQRLWDRAEVVAVMTDPAKRPGQGVGGGRPRKTP